ncbi:MAG: hypothetical protein QOC80_2685, partial [Frankiaceae bacterium]|nr:hypothetical protein [Frankiaceae bacterium]
MGSGGSDRSASVSRGRPGPPAASPGRPAAVPGVASLRSGRTAFATGPAEVPAVPGSRSDALTGCGAALPSGPTVSPDPDDLPLNRAAVRLGRAAARSRRAAAGSGRAAVPSLGVVVDEVPAFAPPTSKSVARAVPSASARLLVVRPGEPASPPAPAAVPVPDRADVSSGRGRFSPSRGAFSSSRGGLPPDLRGFPPARGLPPGGGGVPPARDELRPG